MHNLMWTLKISKLLLEDYIKDKEAKPQKKQKSKLIKGTGETKWVRTKDFDEPSLHNYTKYTPLKES